MSSAIYVEKVICAAKKVLGTNRTDIVESTRLEEELGFDSGMFIELIMELEDTIPGFQVDPAVLKRDDFYTIGSAARFVSSKDRPRE